MEAKEPIILVLTRDEAQAIADLTANVAGCRSTSRRRFSDAVSDQLSSLGIRWSDGAMISSKHSEFAE